MTKKFCGFDLGTMNMVSAVAKENVDEATVKTIRNMFIEVDTDIISTDEIKNTGLDYVVQKDGDVEKFYIIGEDAFRFGQIFNQTPRRPMQHGVISTKDIDAADIITLIAKSILGETKNGVCVYSVPAPAIDMEIPPIGYHERVFGKVLGSLGYESQSLNEGMAIVFDNCKKEKFSGIGISFGCGLVNIACSYSGIKTLAFSVDRGGDWIDMCSANSVGVQISRVTNLKEKKLDLLDSTFSQAKNKSERRVLQALDCYYREMVRYVLRVITKKFEEDSENLSIDMSIPIIVSGGTSLPAGFVELFKEEFDKAKDFPYEISEIRRASDPLNSVAKGCLIYNIWKNKGKQI